VGVEASFIAVDGAKARTVASTLDHQVAIPLAALRSKVSAEDSNTGMLQIGKEEFLAHVVRIEPANDAVHLVLLKSAREVLAPFHAIRNAMYLVSGTALLLAMIVAVLL